MSVKPVWVWHDEAIPGHVFLCVMGLMLLRYLQWEARDLGLTIPGMLEALGEVRGVVWRTPEGKPTLLLERMEGLQPQLANRWKFHEVALG
jgi:transposase